MNQIWQAIIWQRPLRSQKGNIGKCTLEPKTQRIPTSHPLFEIFRAWSFINTIKYNDDENVKGCEKEEIIERQKELKKKSDGFKELSPEIKEVLFKEKFITKSDFKFETVKNFLDKKFWKKCVYNYGINRKTGKYDTSVSGMPFCKGLMDIFNGAVTVQNILDLHKTKSFKQEKIIKGKYSIDDIWHLLFDENNDEDHIEKIAKELGIETQEKV